MTSENKDFNAAAATEMIKPGPDGSKRTFAVFLVSGRKR